MSPGPSGGWLDYEQTMYLVDPNTRTQLDERITWVASGTSARVGRVDVIAPRGSWENLRVEMRVSPLRPERFTLSYVCTAGWIRRLCVNTEHRPFAGTHKHRIVTGAEDAYEPDDIPAVIDGPEVPPSAHEDVFRAFVNECSIVMPPAFDWLSPWEGA